MYSHVSITHTASTARHRIRRALGAAAFIGAYHLIPLSHAMADAPALPVTPAVADTASPNAAGTMPANTSTTAPTASSQPATTVSVPDYSGDLTGDWFGLRTGLADHGISFNGEVESDNSWNLMGGKSTRSFVSQSRVTLGMDLDTDKLFGWPGGQVIASLRLHFGPDADDIQTGSLQPFTFLDDNPPATALYELYYKQTLLRDKLVIQAGRMDANNIFDIPMDATDYLNDSTNDASLAFQNTYPIQAPGLVVFATPAGGTTLIFGAFYDDRFHPTALDALLNTLEPVNQPVGTSLNIELDQNYRLAANMPGMIGVGAFWRTGKLPTLDGGIQSGAGGGWVYVDQTLWQTAKADRRVAAWANFAANDPRVSEIDYSLQAGLLGAGIIPGRPDDKIAVGVDDAHISSHLGTPKPYELAIECFYEWYIGRGITVQPDLQYFNNTGGGAYPDALVATIRLSLAF